MITTIAVAVYLAAAALAARACIAARNGRHRRRVPGWHSGVWLAVAVVFVLVAISRQFGIEESLRIWLRSGLRAEGVYESRQGFQSVLASVVIVAAALAATGGFALMLRSRVLQHAGLSRIVAVAGLAVAAMIVLIVLRLVSLHMLDVLLFRGPRLNWMIDIGSTVVAGAAALRYVRKAQSPAGR